MAVAYVRANLSAQAYTTSQNKTSHTLTYTTAPASGNLLLAHVAVDKASGTFTVPSGWTSLHNDSGLSISHLVMWRIATASESNPVVSWPTAQRCVVAAIYEFSGTHSTTPTGNTLLRTYSDTGVNSVALDPPAQGTSAGAAVAIMALDSVETSDASGFAPTATNWTRHSNSKDGSTNLNSPGIAILSRSVTASEDLASQTFSWTTVDQIQAMIVMINQSSASGHITERYNGTVWAAQYTDRYTGSGWVAETTTTL